MSASLGDRAGGVSDNAAGLAPGRPVGATAALSAPGGGEDSGPRAGAPEAAAGAGPAGAAAPLWPPQGVASRPERPPEPEAAAPAPAAGSPASPAQEASPAQLTQKQQQLASALHQSLELADAVAGRDLARAVEAVVQVARPFLSASAAEVDNPPGASGAPANPASRAPPAPHHAHAHSVSVANNNANNNWGFFDDAPPVDVVGDTMGWLDPFGVDELMLNTFESGRAPPLGLPPHQHQQQHHQHQQQHVDPHLPPHQLSPPPEHPHEESAPTDGLSIEAAVQSEVRVS